MFAFLSALRLAKYLSKYHLCYLTLWVSLFLLLEGNNFSYKSIKKFTQQNVTKIGLTLMLLCWIFLGTQTLQIQITLNAINKKKIRKLFCVTFAF